MKLRGCQWMGWALGSKPQPVYGSLKVGVILSSSYA